MDPPTPLPPLPKKKKEHDFGLIHDFGLGLLILGCDLWTGHDFFWWNLEWRSFQLPSYCHLQLRKASRPWLGLLILGCDLNWPWFLMVESGLEELPIAKLLPFAVEKGFQALIIGRLRLMKPLRNGAFLMGCYNKKGNLLLQSPNHSLGVHTVLAWEHWTQEFKVSTNHMKAQRYCLRLFSLRQKGGLCGNFEMEVLKTQPTKCNVS